MANYKAKGLDCWGRAKEPRMRYYRDYRESHDRGALCWGGGSWNNWRRTKSQSGLNLKKTKCTPNERAN